MAERLPPGFGWLMSAQFLSALADNALLIVTIAHLSHLGVASWWAPLLKFSFTLSYVFLAPFIGALADRVCKRRLMAWTNGLKLLGALALLAGVQPVLAFALVGLGAAVYAPAKYGLLTETVPAAALVAANGWVEAGVVLSVLLGTVLGGGLVAPPWLAVAGPLWTWEFGASSPGLNVSLLVVTACYLASALCNLGIRPSGAQYPLVRRNAAGMVREFWRCNLRLWRDASGGLSLAVTTAFWGVGTVLQFAVLLWGGQVLGLGLDKAAYLQGLVAVGVVIGAALVAARLRLRHATGVLPLGWVMGLVMAASVWLHHWQWAAPSLLLLGVFGGLLVVPMNALLQHRGHRLLTAGQSIAVQGFNENLSILVMLLLYTALLAVQTPVQWIVSAVGLGLAVLVLAIARRRAHAAGLIRLSGWLLRRD